MRYLIDAYMNILNIDLFNSYKDLVCKVFDSDKNEVIEMKTKDIIDSNVAGVVKLKGSKKYAFCRYNTYLIKALDIGLKVKKVNGEMKSPVFEINPRIDFLDIKERNPISILCSKCSDCDRLLQNCRKSINKVSILFRQSYIFDTSKDCVFFINNMFCVSILDIISTLYRTLGNSILYAGVICFKFDSLLNKYHYEVEITDKIRQFIVKYNILMG